MIRINNGITTQINKTDEHTWIKKPMERIISTVFLSCYLCEGNPQNGFPLIRHSGPFIGLAAFAAPLRIRHMSCQDKTRANGHWGWGGWGSYGHSTIGAHWQSDFAGRRAGGLVVVEGWEWGYEGGILEGCPKTGLWVTLVQSESLWRAPVSMMALPLGAAPKGRQGGGRVGEAFHQHQCPHVKTNPMCGINQGERERGEGERERVRVVDGGAGAEELGASNHSWLWGSVWTLECVKLVRLSFTVAIFYSTTKFRLTLYKVLMYCDCKSHHSATRAL